jgi:LCP family protein required for cell wall assembly
MRHIDIINKVLAGFVAFSYAMAVYGVLKTGIMPTKYLLVLIPVTLVVVLLVVGALLRKKERSVAKSILLGILSVLLIAGSGYTYMVSQSTANFLHSAKSTAKKSTGTVITKPYVVYISGIDTYGDVATKSRSDVNIIAVVNPKTKKVLLVNTPRDYYVQLHGTTGSKDKLTHAGIYGIDMSKTTLEDLYGTNIDYTLRINFTSLLKMVDAVGGVDVNSDVAFSAGGYTFVKGVNHLNAKQALVYARERHSFEDGDRQRGKDQQQVIAALISKLSSPSTLVNYQKLLKSLDGTFQTNASSDEVSSIIRQQLDSVGGWSTESISVDGTGATNTTYSMNQPLYVMIPDQTTVNAAKAKINSYLTP